jgi:hypothetical protein
MVGLLSLPLGPSQAGAGSVLSLHQWQVDGVVQTDLEAAQGCCTERISDAIEDLIGHYRDSVGAAIRGIPGSARCADLVGSGARCAVASGRYADERRELTEAARPAHIERKNQHRQRTSHLLLGLRWHRRCWAGDICRVEYNNHALPERGHNKQPQSSYGH